MWKNTKDRNIISICFKKNYTTIFPPFQVFGSLHGEELPYGLGMPLTGGSNHLQQNYTFHEQVLSEVMMHYWANFARTG